MSEQELAARRAKVMGPSYRLFYREPLHLVSGRGVRVRDAAGQVYLDAYNNVPSVGHCHPRVIEALSRQAGILNTHTRYLHETVVSYAERLTALFPAPLDQAVFTCTGSEANDLALRIVRAATGRSGIIVTRYAYHGVTADLVEITPALGPDNPLGPHVRLVDAPDSYRLGAEGARAAFGAQVKAAIADLEASGFGIAALICDTVFASDGIFTDPVGVLAEAVAAVQAAGGLFIADEVQSGLARPGAHMWAYQRHGVAPDLVTLGKPLGAGHPIGAVIARPDLLAAFGARARYFNTFGGNPVSAAVGLAVLDVIRDEELQANAAGVGAHLLAGLHQLAARHEIIGDVRGAGLYATLELVSDRAAKTPDAAATARLVERLRDAHVLVGSCGIFGNCLKIRPPLPFSQSDADELLDKLDGALSRLRA